MPVTRGDSESWTITIRDAEGAAKPLTDVEVFVTYKSSADVPDTEALFQHWIKIEAGVVTGSDSMYLHPDGVASGKLIERLDPDESATLTPGSYVYDVQVGYPSPDVPGEWDIETPINGATDTVVQDITLAVTTPGA